MHHENVISRAPKSQTTHGAGVNAPGGGRRAAPVGRFAVLRRARVWAAASIRSLIGTIFVEAMHSTANTSFYNLSPDLIMEAAEQGGLRPTGYCMALNSYENRVYELAQEDGSHVVAKFYRPGRWTRDQIREEHELLFELRSEEIPVCAPLILAGGQSIREIEGMYYAVWPRTGGERRMSFLTKC